MAAVSSLLPTPVSCAPSRRSCATSPASPRCSAPSATRSSSRGERAATAALAFPVVSLVPARAQHTRLFPLKSMLETPRSSAAALAASAAADAATAAAAAARAAAVAAAAAGAATAANSSDAKIRGYVQLDACRAQDECLQLGSNGAFFSHQGATGATVVITEAAAPLIFPKEPVLPGLSAGVQTSGAEAATCTGSAAEARDTYAFGKDTAAVVAAGITNSDSADLSLACRSVQQCYAESTAVALVSTSLSREEAAAGTEGESARKMDKSDRMHLLPVAGKVQPNGKPSSLPRALSCFSSFSFKCKGQTVSEATSSCHSGTNAASDPLKRGSGNSCTDSSKAGSCTGQRDIGDATLCAGRGLPAAAADAICGEKRQLSRTCEREVVSDAPSGSPSAGPTKEANLRSSELEPMELAGKPQKAQIAGSTPCKMSRRESLLHLPSMAAATAEAACRRMESSTTGGSNNTGESSDTYSNSAHSKSQCGNPQENSSLHNMKAYVCDSSSSAYNSPVCGYNVCSVPAYSSSSSSSGGRDANIFVLGSARQLTPESSRISSRMSCGADDSSLIAHLDFLPAYTTATAGRKGGGVSREGGGAAVEVARRSAAPPTGRRVAAAASEPKGVDALVDSREDRNGEDVFQRRRGYKKRGASLRLRQKEQQQRPRPEDRSQHPLPRCLSMPGELQAACEGMHKPQATFHSLSDLRRLRCLVNVSHPAAAQSGLPRRLTPREVLQLQQQQEQRKKSAEGQEKTVNNVLTSKYLLSSMKLDLLKLRRVEEKCSANAMSSAASSCLCSGARPEVFTPREDSTRRRSNSESVSSVRSYLSTLSASSPSCTLLNSGEAAASIVALTCSSPRSSEASASNVPSFSSTPSFSAASALRAPPAFSSLASSLSCKGRNLLTAVLASIMPIVEPPADEAVAPLQQGHTEADAAAEDNVHTPHYAGSRAANTTVAAVPQCQQFSEWGYHGLSPLDAIEEAEERKVTLLSTDDSTPKRATSIIIQGADEVELLRGTSFRRDTIIQHSLARAKDLWEKVLSCCW